MFQLLPMQKIITDCMSPGHITPDSRLGVVLKIHMPYAVAVDEAIRVINPVFFCSEMKLGSVQFIVVGHGSISLNRNRSPGAVMGDGVLWNIREDFTKQT